MTSVREEINSYGRGDAHSYLLSESNRIESAHKMTEHVIKYRPTRLLSRVALPIRHRATSSSRAGC